MARTNVRTIRSVPDIPPVSDHKAAVAVLPLVRSTIARLIAVSVLILCLCALPVYAYVPHAGDRAAPLSGRDITTNEVVTLDDYRGRWVVVEFWSTSCGACTRQLPELLRASDGYRLEGKLELLLVNLDTVSNASRVKQVLRELRVDCPVIFPGKRGVIIGPPQLTKPELNPDSFAPQAVAWGISSLPAVFLVNPDGVIVAKRLPSSSWGAALHHFIEGSVSRPWAGVRASFEASGSTGDSDSLSDVAQIAEQDLRQLELRVELYSPQREPLTAQLDYYLISAEVAEIEGCRMPTKRRFIQPNPDEPEETAVISFTDSCEAVWSLTIDAQGYAGVQYVIRVLIPGTKSLDDGRGIWTKQIGNVYFDYP